MPGARRRSPSTSSRASPTSGSTATATRLKPGNGVGFRAGTGIAHGFLNNTQRDVHLLVVGEHEHADNRFTYPLHPERDAALGPRLWADAPKRAPGPQDGLPDRRRRGG